MKILLLNPPNLEEVKLDADSIPMGLRYIREVLEQGGHDVGLVNLAASRDWDEVRAALGCLDFDLVGITCYTPQRLSVYKLAGLCRQVTPAASIVVGGPHATFLDRAILEKIEAIDFVIRNEGEFCFLELADALANNEKNWLGEIRGLTYRDEGGIIRNPDRERNMNLSGLPLLKYNQDEVDAFSLSRSLTFSFDMLGANRRVASILNSRGCNNQCLFCCNGSFWDKQYYFSPEYVYKQIRYFHDAFNVRMFDFSDDDFLFSKSYVTALCDLIVENGLDISWWCAGRSQDLDLDVLVKMKQAGCFMVSYGFESGSEKIRENIRKGSSVEDAVHGSRLAKEAGMMVRCTLTVGHPGESMESILETVEFLKEAKPDQVGLYLLKVYPGTPIYERFKSEGGISDDYWFDEAEKCLPFYTAENSLPRQIEYRDMIVESLRPFVVEQYGDDVFHVEHLTLRWLDRAEN